MDRSASYEQILRRIGDRIHDGPLQYLSGAKMWLDSAVRSSESQPMSSHVEDLKNVANGLMAAIRDLRQLLSILVSESNGTNSVMQLATWALLQFQLPVEQIVLVDDDADDFERTAPDAELFVRILAIVLDAIVSNSKYSVKEVRVTCASRTDVCMSFLFAAAPPVPSNDLVSALALWDASGHAFAWSEPTESATGTLLVLRIPTKRAQTQS